MHTKSGFRNGSSCRYRHKCRHGWPPMRCRFPERRSGHRLCFTWTDDCAVIHQSVGCHTAYIPAVSAVIDDIADKSGAVKAGRWRRTAPDIWVSQIFLRLADHVGKTRIGQSLTGDVILQVFIAGRDIRIIIESSFWIGGLLSASLF